MLFFILNAILLVASISFPQFMFLSLVLMAFALVLLSFWVWEDGLEIERLHEQIDRLMKKQEKEK